MRILIGGGAGFIGGHFAEYARKSWPTARITVVDNLSFAGVRANLDSFTSDRRFRLVVGDITNAPLIEKLMKETDLLVNFAAETHVDRSLLAAGTFLQSSVIGTHVLVETARRLGTVKKLVLMSTDEVYGPVLRGAASEDSRLDPSSPYSAAKASGDLLALTYARSFGVPVVIPRGCNIYGPRQFPEKMIPVMITNAIDDKPLPVYGNGRQQREWMHVSDACRALVMLAKRGAPGGIYNIGSGTWARNIEVVRRILSRLGKPASLIRHVADRPGHDLRYAVRASRLKALGWKPLVKFSAGLDATVDWYRDHPGWWRPLQNRSRSYFRAQYGRRLAPSRSGR